MSCGEIGFGVNDRECESRRVGQVRMQDVNGVWCDSAEELVVRSAEQVGDGRQIVVAVAEPLAATHSNESRRARSVAEHIPDHAGAAYSTMHQSVRQLQAILDIYSGQPRTPADQILEHDQFRWIWPISHS